MKILLFLWAFFKTLVQQQAWLPQEDFGKRLLQNSHSGASAEHHLSSLSVRLRASSVLASDYRDLVHLPKVNLSLWEGLTQSSCEL